MISTTLQPRELAERSFRLRDIPMPDGRLEVWEEAQEGRVYAAGFDFAYGVGRNYDAGVVFDKSCQAEGKPVVQVAELHGNAWGPSFHLPGYMLMRYYNDAFTVGERQVGLFTLRRWWDEYGYRKLYRQRSVTKTVEVAAPNADLGWHRGADDKVLNDFRIAVKERRVILRSPQLLDQMRRLRYSPRKEGEAADDYRSKLQLRNAQPGESPDLVMAAAYAWLAVCECHVHSRTTENETGRLGFRMGDTVVKIG